MTQTLTKATFLEKIFNFEKHQEWKFEGNKPAIIDFYADWCGPCKMLSPILEQLSEEYKGAIDIYKIDTEVEQELAAAFDIRSIPSMLFCPMNDAPQFANGALPKTELERVIADVLKTEKPV
jgi:thioredoxin